MRTGEHLRLLIFLFIPRLHFLAIPSPPTSAGVYVYLFKGKSFVRFLISVLVNFFVNPSLPIGSSSLALLNRYPLFIFLKPGRWYRVGVNK